MPTLSTRTTSRTGFVIDCDGTLLDTEVVWTRAERATVERHGGTWSHALKASFLGRTPATTAALILAHVGAPSADHPVVYEQLLTAYDAELAAGAPLMPGALELLHALAELNIPAGVASNSPAAQVETALARAGLRALVGPVVCPDVDVPPKPSPDIYLRACERLAVDPDVSVSIEDTQPGVDAARAAGLLTIGVPSPLGHPDADHLVPTLWPLDLQHVLRLARS